MDKVSLAAGLALKQAKEALQGGDKHNARHWAQIAVSLAPDMEEPWLILASVARGRARIAYLEQALRMNSGNERTLSELEQAYLGLDNEKALSANQVLKIPPPQGQELIDQEPAVNKVQAASFLRIAIPAVIIASVLAIAGTTFSALAAMRGRDPAPSGVQIQSYQSQVDFRIPSEAPSSTPTFVPVLNPTSTPSPQIYMVVQPENTVASKLTVTPQAANTLLEQKLLPVTGQPVGGKLIVVNIHEQHLYAYQGGALVYSFPASTGANNNTRTGAFRILDKIPNAYDPDRNFWMPDWLGIYYVGDLENGFHSPPVLSNGQRMWANEIGTPVTDGCIVPGIADSLKLYGWADVGTAVQINP
jgi:lipoprotein-anchoring transpeptidase ErfK/SrfK